MEQIIEIKQGFAYHKGIKLGTLVNSLIHHFKLKDEKKYIVTIVEAKRGKFIVSIREGYYYHFYKRHILFSSLDSYVGLICKDTFNKLFFLPDDKKRYNVIIKEVRK